MQAHFKRRVTDAVFNWKLPSPLFAWEGLPYCHELFDHCDGNIYQCEQWCFLYLIPLPPSFLWNTWYAHLLKTIDITCIGITLCALLSTVGYWSCSSPVADCAKSTKWLNQKFYENMEAFLLENLLYIKNGFAISIFSLSHFVVQWSLSLSGSAFIQLYKSFGRHAIERFSTS